jgi:hypothetical protein
MIRGKMKGILHMQHELIVRSVVIAWPEQTMEITDTAGNKHTIPLGTTIQVTMRGYPDREQKTMLARELNPYMMKGYVIERIDFSL